MPTRLGIVSDVHAAPGPLREALAWFEQQQVDDIICAGDIAGYFDELGATVNLLQDYRVKTVSGNHDSAWLAEHADGDVSCARYLADLPRTLTLCYEGMRIRVLHAEPPDCEHGGIKLLDLDGNTIRERKSEWAQKLAGENCDIMIVGHTHQVFAEKLGALLVINPGSSVFNHSCAMLELPSEHVSFHALQGREILKSWNFSMLRSEGDLYPKRAG